MFDLNYKKPLSFSFIYLFLIAALSSCSWYKCEAIGSLLYNPIYTKEDLSDWNTDEQLLILGREVSGDRIQNLSLRIKSPASKEYLFNHLMSDLKTYISHETIYRKFISQIEIEHYKQTNIITITIPHLRRDSGIAKRLIDNLIVLLLYESDKANQKEYNRLKKLLFTEKSDRENKLIKQLINKHETRIQLVEQLESDNQVKKMTIRGDFEIVEWAKKSCPIF